MATSQMKRAAERIAQPLPVAHHLINHLRDVNSWCASTHQLAGEGQDGEVESQAQRQPGIRLCVPHQLQQLARALVLACSRQARGK